MDGDGRWEGGFRGKGDGFLFLFLFVFLSFLEGNLFLNKYTSKTKKRKKKNTRNYNGIAHILTTKHPKLIPQLQTKPLSSEKLSPRFHSMKVTALNLA